jgi:hypothetical protein
MKTKFTKYFLISATCLLLGLGCAKAPDVVDTKNQIQLDTSLKLFVNKPEGWDVKKFNTLYKNPKTPSGYTYVTGGINYGLGSKNAKGDLVIKIHVIAIPKSYVEAYEKGKFPLNAERKLETPEYMVYTATIDSGDSNIEGLIKSIVIKP